MSGDVLVIGFAACSRAVPADFRIRGAGRCADPQGADRGAGGGVAFRLFSLDAGGGAACADSQGFIGGLIFHGPIMARSADLCSAQNERNCTKSYAADFLGRNCSI